MKHSALRLSAITLAALALAACSIFNGAETYRYRITVEVDTPQGLRSGSSVWETSASMGSEIPDRSIRSRVRGEAVSVDLPGGTMFALLRGADMNVDYAAGAVEGHVRTHPEPGVPVGKDWAEIVQAIIDNRPAFELYPDEYPLLVRFRDIKDPASVEKVDPADLAASFGPGARLRRITVAVTEDGITTGVDARLTWLSEQSGTFVRAPQCTPRDQRPLPAMLNASDFRKERR